jgi:quinolinate synthase
MANIKQQICELRKQRNAVILSHTYQPAEIQDLADYVGDSYGLSKQATQVDADMIVFCGVQFMAETAAILNPERTVVMPDKTAGCPMADMITADQLRELKSQHPDAAVVCYVNSTAEVKAESTICCTSSNAVRIVNSLPADQPVIFVPDRYLGRFVERHTGRNNMIIWDGFCPTHARLDAETIRRARAEHPDAEVMVHPECMPETQDQADHVISTGQMCDLVETTTCKKFLVGTEEGILHTLRKKAPHIEFISLSPSLVCFNMKKTTVAKVIDALRTGEPRITVPPAIADKARNAIQAMLNVAG